MARGGRGCTRLPRPVHARGQPGHPCSRGPCAVPFRARRRRRRRERPGYWGEVLTTGALARGLGGLVIDGGVRDVAALERLGFPVFSRTVALRGATKSAPGTIGSALDVAGVEVAAGDWVVGDVDGVVIVPGGALDEVLSAARTRTAAEVGYFSALRGGATTVELLGLDASLIDDGVARLTARTDGPGSRPPVGRSHPSAAAVSCWCSRWSPRP